MFLKVDDVIKSNPFLKSLKERYDNGEQNIILSVGDTNSGKTAFNILLFYLIKKGILKKSLNTENLNMYFSVVDFAKDIAKLNSEVIFYDEGGIELDRGEWNNDFNKTLRHIFQTQRVKKNFYLILVPHQRFISNVSMPLFNYQIIIHKVPIRNSEGEVVGFQRQATIYHIKTAHFNSGYADYYYYKRLKDKKGNKVYFNIPDLTKIENRDFKKLYAEFHKQELEKKQMIAFDIEDRINSKVLEEKTKILKRKMNYEKMKEKAKDVDIL